MIKLITRHVIRLLVIFLPFFLLIQCSERDKNTKYIPPKIKENTHPIDKYLRENNGKSLLEKYGTKVRWRWENDFVKPSQSATPIEERFVIPTAKVVEHLWIDPYTELGDAGEKLISNIFPSELILVGSNLYQLGTRLLGIAEGGTRITLFNCNSLNLGNRSWFFSRGTGVLQTIHHEFSHIVHQNYGIPLGLDKISPEGYKGGGWRNLGSANTAPLFEAISLGMTSAYATTNVNEDFCELVSNYLLSDKDWFKVIFEPFDCSDLENTSKKWRFPANFCDDINAGKKIIAKKLELVKKYYMDELGIDLSKLRATTQNKLNYVVRNKAFPE